MRIFDANLILGRLGWRPIGVDSVAQMLPEMDRFGIEKGLLSHLTACIHDAEVGNFLLFEAVKGHEDRLLPVPVVDLNDNGAWLELLPNWVELGVAAIRLCPLFYKNSVRSEYADRLAEVAQERDWPVLVALETVRNTPWTSGLPRQAIEFAERHPEIRVLALGANRNHIGELMPALQSCSNLYLELSQLETGGALEQLVQLGVGDRLLCGSSFGVSYANVAIERVRRCGISEPMKCKILYENALAFISSHRKPE